MFVTRGNVGLRLEANYTHRTNYNIYRLSLNTHSHLKQIASHLNIKTYDFYHMQIECIYSLFFM